MVTVVVPMRNEEGFIGECLDSLIRQDYPSDRLEVLVVDGRSEDASRSIVLEKGREHDFIRLLDNPKRIAPSALNIGVHNAAGDVIIIVGAHIFVASDFISKNVAYLSRTGVDCVGGPIEAVSQSFAGKAISLAISCPFGVGNSLFRYSQKEQYVDTVAYPAYRREVFERVGYFDEALVRNQDIEFSYRLRQSGGKILLTPEVRSYYYPRSSLKGLWKQNFANGFWNVKTMRKTPGSLSVRHFIPLVFVVALGSSLLLSPFFMPARLLLLLILSSYFALALGYTIVLGRRKGLCAALLPLVFPTLHVSYGLGSLWGSIKWARESLNLNAARMER
jgi:cellulose synthase/poly-beta-1,6-N-acetylglucosamine synthase-like glycosyltransferase